MRGLLRLAGAAAVFALVAPAAGVPAAAAATTVGPAAGAPAAAATPAPAPVTYGIGPATGGKADKRADLNYTLSPGARLSDQVVVVNRSAVALTLSVYAADATNGANGAVTYQPKANPGDGARTWITLHLPRGATGLRVPARRSTIVPIDVYVPSNATPGDHLAGIRVATTARATTTDGKSVAFEQGVALPTHFRVSGDLVPKLAVEHLTASYHGTANPVGSGHTSVSYTVHNTGNVTLGAAQRATVSNLFGEHGPTPRLGAVPTLLPGGSYAVSFDVPGTYPALELTARVRLTPMAVDTVAATPLTPVEASTGVLAVPWALLAVVLFVAALAAGALVWRRKRPRALARHHRPHRPQRRGGPAAASGKA